MPFPQVVSGGVACNGYLRDCLRVVCQETGYTLACPPPRLCTDNGVMIAWNGVERWRQGLGVVTVEAVDSVTTAGKYVLGLVPERSLLTWWGRRCRHFLGPIFQCRSSGVSWMEIRLQRAHSCSELDPTCFAHDPISFECTSWSPLIIRSTRFNERMAEVYCSITELASFPELGLAIYNRLRYPWKQLGEGSSLFV